MCLSIAAAPWCVRVQVTCRVLISGTADFCLGLPSPSDRPVDGAGNPSGGAADIPTERIGV
jgi:hypothetical protein